MNEQFKLIEAWQCKECGRVLRTSKGLARHKLKCKYAEHIIEGQVRLDEEAYEDNTLCSCTTE